MSLVAYGNSDASSDEEEDSKTEVSLSNSNTTEMSSRDVCTFETKSPKPSSSKDENDAETPNFASVLPKPKESSSFFEEDITKRLMFSTVHLPKNSSMSAGVSGNKSSDSRKTVNSSRNNLSGNVAKKTVKITLPSLSEFSDEDEESKPKKLKPSAKGSGLFALLPAPKNLVVKETNRPLIPRVISKPPPPKIPSKPTRPVRAPIKDKSESLINYPDSGEESGEEGNEGADFFSLTGRSQDNVCSNPTLDASNDVVTVNHRENLLTEVITSSTSSEVLPSTSAPIFPQRPTEQQQQQHTALPDSPPESHEENILQLDNDAINRLCGRRGREEIIDAQVIDVCGESHLPDPKEWLTKQFTEEQETRSHSHRKRDGPTTQQRRKHQITYLAFQAKERELELKNQWAQNKISRKQTQSKYGF